MATWMRKCAIVGGVLGCLGGVAHGLQTEPQPLAVGVDIIRYSIGGAAMGAAIPAWVKAAGFAIGAALWLVLAACLWGIALAATGQTDWVTRLR